MLGAALIWGIGNAVTGFTAQKYPLAVSVLPAIDIAAANTAGGLVLLALGALFLASRRRAARFHGVAPFPSDYTGCGIVSPRSVVAGVLKGANTCLFVFSTTYIAATQSLVLESTYIIWSVILSAMYFRRTVRVAQAASIALPLFAAAALTTGAFRHGLGGFDNPAGTVLGLGAGLSYALYLIAWSLVTAGLEDFGSQLRATCLLLAVSLVTIVLSAELISLLFLHRVWIPLANLSAADALVQTVNGMFVIGVVYLLVTVGMRRLRRAMVGAGSITAFCLSFAIPFTLIPELFVGKFVPTVSQLTGLILFMVCFILMSVFLSKSEPHT